MVVGLGVYKKYGNCVAQRGQPTTVALLDYRYESMSKV